MARSRHDGVLERGRHLELRYIEDSCPILAPDQSDERFVVAWRNDPRPLVGIYEGVYVHLHVLMALSACIDARRARRCGRHRVRGASS